MVGASLVMLGIALHMTILSYQSANASEQKKLRELEDRHYIRYRNILLFELFPHLSMTQDRGRFNTLISSTISSQKMKSNDITIFRQHVQSAILRKSMVYETGSTLKIR